MHRERAQRRSDASPPRPESQAGFLLRYSTATLEQYGERVEQIISSIQESSGVDRESAIRIAKDRGLIEQDGEHLVAAKKNASTVAPLVYRGPIKPRVDEQPNGKFTIRDVPIFQTHESRGWNCDEQWMQKAVAQQRTDKHKGFNPRLIIGHTPDDPDGEEKPVVGFLDNFRFSASEGWLYADFVDVPEHVMERFKNNEFPGRSVEVIPDKHSIPAVAVLGGSEPFFKLPDLRFSGDKNAINYSVRESYTMPSDTKKNEATPDTSEMNEEMREMIRKVVQQELKQMQKNATDNGDDDKPEDEDMNDKNKKSAETEQEKYTSDDASMVHKYDQLAANHEDLKQRYDALQERLATMEYTNERQKWEAKYDALHIPPGIEDRENAVEQIMAVPADQRESVFQLYRKLSRGPATRPTDLEDSEPSGPQDFESQERAIREYYNAHRDKYRGDFPAARRDFLRQQNAAKPE